MENCITKCLTASINPKRRGRFFVISASVSPQKLDIFSILKKHAIRYARGFILFRIMPYTENFELGNERRGCTHSIPSRTKSDAKKVNTSAYATKWCVFFILPRFLIFPHFLFYFFYKERSAVMCGTRGDKTSVQPLDGLHKKWCETKEVI